LGTYVWPNNFIGQTFAEEINYLKTWLSNRLAWLDANMVGTCDNLSMPEPQKEALRIFPNPSDHVVFLEGLEKPSCVRIYHATGALAASVRLSSYTSAISTESLPNGMYYLQVDGNPTLFKLLILHL